MPKVASLQCSELLRPSRKILSEFDRIEENTRRHLLSLPRSQTIKLPSISELQLRQWPRSAVVLARGPSFFKKDYILKLKQARDMGHKFFLVAADGTVAHCLDIGLVPDISASVDPSIRILRWVGDIIGANDNDEYFLKDRDAPRDNKALLSKERTISLFDKYGEKLTVSRKSIY